MNAGLYEHDDLPLSESKCWTQVYPFPDQLLGPKFVNLEIALRAKFPRHSRVRAFLGIPKLDNISHRKVFL